MRITPELIIAVAMILLISFPVHEFSHALAAYRLGDGTAKMMGRLTLNPIAHFDPLGAALLCISAVFGRGHRLGQADAGQPEHAPATARPGRRSWRSPVRRRT